MAKGEDHPKRIEAVFERTGLGNFDRERLTGLVENFEHAMVTASRVRSRKGRKFKDNLQKAGEKPPEEES